MNPTASNSIQKEAPIDCPEGRSLFQALSTAVQNVIALNEAQVRAYSKGIRYASDLDPEIQEAESIEHNARQAYMAHRKSHSCQVTPAAEYWQAAQPVHTSTASARH